MPEDYLAQALRVFLSGALGANGTSPHLAKELDNLTPIPSQGSEGVRLKPSPRPNTARGQLVP